MTIARAAYHYILWAFLLMTGFVLISVWLAPGPSNRQKALPGPVPAAAESWPLSTTPGNKQKVEKAYRQFIKGLAIIQSVNEKKTSNYWQLRGLVRVDKERLALIETKGVVKRFARGARLPGGAVLRKINDSSIVVRQAGEARTIRLYEP